ncbi:MAG: efflux transporter outer membrane subunit [Methylococcales bacterium]|nr:efflux transporter outer membrane subunit [Methylococcales bacterium]
MHNAWKWKWKTGRLLAAGLSMLLTACTVGPDYRPPQPDMPANWVEPTAASGDGDGLTEWWRGFNDPRLNSLVERAMQGNLDLRAAWARIESARAQTQVADAASWPTVNVSGNYQREKISRNALLGMIGSLQNGGLGGGNQSSVFGPIGTPFNLFQAGFDSSWELDLFGGIRRQQEAAAANAEAGIENLRDIQVSLAAEVARVYLELTAQTALLAIAQDNVKNQQVIRRLSVARFQEGMATALDEQRAQADLDTAEANVAPLDAQVHNSRHALALLLGLPPGGLDAELAQIAAEVPAPTAIRPGLPAELLRRRPDIRQAERQVASASAAIGVAVAELFPKLTLTGTAGFQSQELGNFTSMASGLYGFGPHLSLPIFQAGRLQANIAGQEARHRESLAAYDKTVLIALREVEDSLATITGEHSRRAALENAEQSARSAAGSAAAYYVEGETDLQNVLDSRRVWQNSRQQLVQGRLNWAIAHVGLFKALGGGW